MALIDRKATAPKPEPLNIPKVQPEAYKTAVLEENNKPFQSMIAYVEGAPWNVDYYSQVLGKNSELKMIDTSAHAVHQSYSKISNLEIRVTSPLSDSYDNETSTMKTTGTGHIYGGVVPNVEDHFITQTSDREPTIFRVTSVDALSMSRDTVYEVSYMVVGRVEDNKDIFNSLTNKVAKNFEFIKNRINEGNSPLVVKEDYKRLLDLGQAYRDLLNYYMTTFWSKGNRMMLVPGQDKRIYDYNIIEFLFKLVDPTDHNALLDVQRVPNAPSIFADQINIFDVLIERSSERLDQCNRKYGFVRSDAGGQNSYICGPSFYDLDYIVYPKEHDETTSIPGITSLTLSDYRFKPTVRKGTPFVEPENTRIAISNGNVPLIYNVHNEGCYVFSPAFYDGGYNVSALEILVRDYLTNKTLDLNILNRLLTEYKVMVRLDQFYYIPILILLVKEASRGIYS